MAVNITQPMHVPKPWGYEEWIYNDSEYCGKRLVFPNKLSKFSMHYHLIKKESWYVQQGSFIFSWIDIVNGKLQTAVINPGDSVTIERGQPHQLIAVEDNSIVFEVSTEHFNEDSYRIYLNTPNDLI